MEHSSFFMIIIDQLTMWRFGLFPNRLIDPSEQNKVYQPESLKKILLLDFIRASKMGLASCNRSLCGSQTINMEYRLDSRDEPYYPSMLSEFPVQV